MDKFLEHNFEAKLVYNDPKKRIKVLNEINRCLDECDSFSFSVAFLNGSGLQSINQAIYDLEERGVKGRLITSNYLDFNSPATFRDLLKFKNIEVRIFKEKEFHPKGYIFTKEEERKIIVGSSNITSSALSTNQEWNILLNSYKNQDIVKRVEKEFEEQWNNSFELTPEWIDEYEKTYQPIKARSSEKNEVIEFKPNSMQKEAVLSLAALRREGKNKALLISATGTGKTYLSAFDVKQFDAKKVLFVVHRECIAKDAKDTFLSVMSDKKCGLFCGTTKDRDCDYLFATIQTIGKEEYLNEFDKEYFDYIVIDEVHHLGAESYQALFNHFLPKFTLGMTATPERTDGYDIFKDFDYNIAYEIRLQQAMEEDLLCPFHYYGVSDVTINGEQIDDYTDINYLTREERVKHIISASEKYSFSGEKVHGLIFVSRIEEAKKISEILNKNGYKSAPITGTSTNVDKAIDLLESNDNENYYDYLVCVDKFNEGIDIPGVNQIIMARPTSSPTIFIQQLGRGLRKAKGKEYTVVIDLIGNYTNNFLIPVALSGDRTYNVDTIRKYMISGKQFLPGTSTINFDDISKERIYKSIDSISSIRNKYNELIKNSYDFLTTKLGRRPYLIDFLREQEVDPMLIIEKNRTYYELINKLGVNEYDFDNNKVMCLAYLSKTILDGKRDTELKILKKLLSCNRMLLDDLAKELKCNDDELFSSINVLKGNFEQKDSVIENNKKFLMIDTDEMYIWLTDEFIARLEDEEFKKEIEDIINTGLEYNVKNYSPDDEYPFVLSQKYTRRDVCRLLNNDKDISSTMYGMHSFGDDSCLFVTYNKANPLDERNYVDGKPDYADTFIDESVFEWESQVGRGIDSSYMEEIRKAKNIRLFVKKSDAETNFYYMGKVDIINMEESQKKDNNNNDRKVTKVKFLLNKPVEKELLDYLSNY